MKVRSYFVSCKRIRISKTISPNMSDVQLKRVVIYPKDIQFITGQSESTCRKIIRDIKMKLGKSKEEYVTIDEFCAHKGLDKNSGIRFIY